MKTIIKLTAATVCILALAACGGGGGGNDGNGNTTGNGTGGSNTTAYSYTVTANVYGSTIDPQLQQSVGAGVTTYGSVYLYDSDLTPYNSRNASALVSSGSMAAFDLWSHYAGYAPSIGDNSTCNGGSWRNNYPFYTYTTGPVTADCTVSFVFKETTYNVVISVGTGGTVAWSMSEPSSPGSLAGNTQQTIVVSAGGRPHITVTPDKGYTVSSVNGNYCRATNSNYAPPPTALYIMDSISNDCVVKVNFAPSSPSSPSSPTSPTSPTYTVTPVRTGTYGGTYLSITPSTPVSVQQGKSATFTVKLGGAAPSISGTCGGTMTYQPPNIIYTTSPITSDCTVVFQDNTRI